ncbi:MAG: sulfotransferase domain-containing protein [Phycisphaerae bacterium]|nr:sulfotransferase domain-containing protein [Phycisphaerae bacterium]
MAGQRDFVTIVSGLPRSGTSMMMKMLDAGGIPALTDNLRRADEDNPKGYYEFEPVKQTKKDASWLEQAPGKVVKMVHLLLMDLPEGYQYRVIFMRRRLEEVIASQDVMLERKGKGGAGLSPERMIEIFQKQIDQVDAWVRARSHFGIIHVNYNDMLGNPRPLVTQVNEFLGGDLNTDEMFKVVDPSLYRQRR